MHAVDRASFAPANKPGLNAFSPQIFCPSSEIQSSDPTWSPFTANTIWGSHATPITCKCLQESRGRQRWAVIRNVKTHTVKYWRIQTYKLLTKGTQQVISVQIAVQSPPALSPHLSSRDIGCCRYGPMAVMTTEDLFFGQPNLLVILSFLDHLKTLYILPQGNAFDGR